MTGHRGLGAPEVWVIPAVNADQPEGPEEKERQESKRMRFVDVNIFI